MAYGGLVAVRDVDLLVGAGQIVGVVGLNGAGKSSLLRGISGLVPMRGECRLAGESVSGDSTATRASKGLGHVPEGRRLFPRMSVRENLEVGALGAGRRRSGDVSIQTVIDQHLPAVAGLLHRRADSLSGGEQQQVAIARALMASPTVLLMDEPSLGLSPIAVQGVANIIHGLAEAGTGIVLAEQNVSLALRLASKIYVLAFGSIVDVVDAEGAENALQYADDIYRLLTEASR